jgi:hypothetical protein
MPERQEVAFRQSVLGLGLEISGEEEEAGAEIPLPSTGILDLGLTRWARQAVTDWRLKPRHPYGLCLTDVGRETWSA